LERPTNNGDVEELQETVMRAFLACLCLCLFVMGSSAADGATIKIATEGLYPPWNATDDDGDLEGFEIDLAQDLCQRMQVTCELISQRWDGLLPALTAGDYDVVMAGMTITDERERLIDFSLCYATEVAVFAVRSDNALAATIVPQERIDLDDFNSEVKTSIKALRQALAGTAVGVQIATTHAAFVERYLSDLVEIEYHETLQSLTLDLDAGRIDSALSSRSDWKRWQDDENALEYALIGPDMAGGVFGKGVGAGLRQGDDDLREKFNQAIQAALDDGTISRLSKRWFGYDLSC
jgi:octopine/nopaline transport system substrate-binding protein